MTRLRRLLHAFGWHWWTAWRNVLEPVPFYNVYRVKFQRRHCRVPGCGAEQRRVREVE